MLASPGGRADAGGRVVLTWEGRAEAGDVLASLGGRANAGGRVVFAREGRAVTGDALASLGRAVAGGGVVLAWEGTDPSLGGVFTWEGVIPSLGGLAWEGVIPSLGGLTWELFMFTWELFRLCEAKLFEAKLLLLVLLDLVIFPSFLIVSKFSLFNSLSLTLLNLVSPTLSMKSWHSLSFCVETIVASFDLHSSNCLDVWSKM